MRPIEILHRGRHVATGLVVLVIMLHVLAAGFGALDGWLCRVVDQNGVILDILVQERRDQVAAERFLRRVLEGEGAAEPRVVITDKLASYPRAIRRALPHVEHRRHKGLNNRAENSHLPTRKRERILQRFKSAELAATVPDPV